MNSNNSKRIILVKQKRNYKNTEIDLKATYKQEVELSLRSQIAVKAKNTEIDVKATYKQEVELGRRSQPRKQT
jgi:hypothetical protein